MTITIYTDGGCNPNPGPGGWAALIIMPDGQERVLSGSEHDTTNNRMELTAALRALQAVPVHSEVDLYTDSQYLRDGITEWLDAWQRQGWKKSDGKGVLNRDLWEALAEVIQQHRLKWHWVRGHTGNAYNERVDRIASAAIPTPTSQETEGAVRIYIHVSCAGQNGGWAARIVTPNAAQELSGAASPTTSNRLELQAAIAAVECAPSGHPLAVYTASDYLYKGMTQWLSGWQKRGWQTSNGTPVKNADLWQKLARLNAQHSIRWVWRHGDAPPGEADGLDQLASAARQKR